MQIIHIVRDLVVLVGKECLCWQLPSTELHIVLFSEKYGIWPLGSDEKHSWLLTSSLSPTDLIFSGFHVVKFILFEN